MTSIAKRALRFLENLEDDALRSFIDEIEVLEPEEDDESSWVMGGATEHFERKAQKDLEEASPPPSGGITQLVE